MENAPATAKKDATVSERNIARGKRRCREKEEKNKEERITFLHHIRYNSKSEN